MAFTLNGHPIANSLSDVRIDSLLPNAVLKSAPSIRRRPDTMIVSDSSAFKAAILVLDTVTSISENCLTFPFTVEEKILSSGFRELLALSKSLAHFKAKNYKRLNILWLTDSENVVAFMNNGLLFK